MTAISSSGSTDSNSEEWCATSRQSTETCAQQAFFACVVLVATGGSTETALLMCSNDVVSWGGATQAAHQVKGSPHVGLQGALTFPIPTVPESAVI